MKEKERSREERKKERKKMCFLVSKASLFIVRCGQSKFPPSRFCTPRSIYSIAKHLFQRTVPDAAESAAWQSCLNQPVSSCSGQTMPCLAFQMRGTDFLFEKRRACSKNVTFDAELASKTIPYDKSIIEF